MGVAFKFFDDSTLGKLAPLDKLNAEQRRNLLSKAMLEEIPAGGVLFERGDTVERTFYALDGEVELVSPLYPPQTVHAGSETALYPVSHSLPRQVTARAKTAVTVLVLDLDILQSIESGPAPASTPKPATAVTPATPPASAPAAPAPAPAPAPAVAAPPLPPPAAARPPAEETGPNGMARWLESPLFRHLPKENITALLTRMREIHVQAGQVIIHQNEKADSYYVIKKGRCSISRKPSAQARDVKLAELLPGQGFGEEALITNATRNASVTMMEDGTLLRLSKEDFIQLLVKPLVRQITFNETLSMINNKAVLVDVRSPEEFETNGLIGSLSMPMPVLRLKANRLNSDRPYIVYCDDGYDSTAAAFLLIQQGRDAYVLKDGLGAAPAYRMKQTRVSSNAPSPAGEVHSIANTPPAADDRPAPGATPTLTADQLAWVSDDVLWKTTLGYRNDPAVEQMLSKAEHASSATQKPGPAPAPAPAAQPAATAKTIEPAQGFGDVHLFTPIPQLQNNAPDAQETPPPESTVEPLAINNTLTITQRQPRNEPFAPEKEPLFRRPPVMAIVLSVVIVAGFGVLYISNQGMREHMAEVPAWIQHQKELDAKVTRMLEALEKIPKAQQETTPAQITPAPVKNPPRAPASTPLAQ